MTDVDVCWLVYRGMLRSSGGEEMGLVRSAVWSQSHSSRHTKITKVNLTDGKVDFQCNLCGRPSIKSKNSESPFDPLTRTA